jgi:hypothetical protein
MPFSCPVAVGAAVGVELPPFSYTATYDTLIDAPDVVTEVGVVQRHCPFG